MKVLKFIAAIILLWPALAHATFDSSCTGTFTPAGGYQNGCATGVKSTATACWPGGLCDSPTGVMPPAGDICIAVLKNALTTATISTVPSNWNLIHAFNGGGTTESVAFYWYLATGSEGATYSPVFAWSSGAAVTTEIVCFSGDNTTSPIDANNTSGVFLGSTGATSINVTALATLAQNGDDLLLTASSRSGTVTFSGPTSPYSVVHVTGFFSGSTLDSATWQGNNGASTTPPNSTVQTVTQSGSSVAMSGYALALAPATGPTATPTATPTSTAATPPATPTATATGPTPTPTATATATPTATPTAATPTPTCTVPCPSPTPTATPTATATATATPTAMPTGAISPAKMQYNLGQTWWWESPWVGR